MFCNQCGKENNNDAKFCSSCGFPIKKADSSPNATPIIENQILCPNCGTRIDPEDKFCGKCGFKLK